MILWRFLLAATAASSATLTFAQSLPVPVPNRIGRGGEFTYQYTPEQYATKLSTRDVYWSAQATTGQGGYNKLYYPANTFSGVYAPVNRVPAHAFTIGKIELINACGNAPAAGGCTMAWFQHNHPSWIIYRNDQVTPAYMFGDTGYPPLDISNSVVQTWLISSYYAPMMALGGHAIDQDNVSPRNDWGEAGVCSIKPTTNCTSDGGTWTQLYDGNKVVGDAAFVAARVQWALTLTAWAHSIGKSTMANVTYEPNDSAGTANIVNAYDIWYDEAGFTGDSDPSACELTPYASGSYWINKLAFVTGLNGGAGPNAYVSENSICPAKTHYPSGKNFEMVEYAVATHLLHKNSHSYLWMFFSIDGVVCGPAAYCDDTDGGSWPQYWLEHGAASGAYTVTGNIYNRTFANTLALVNPSLTTAYKYNLASKVFYRSDCTRYTGTITVPSGTGMVLTSHETSNCVH
jgi:hypothetical protein